MKKLSLYIGCNGLCENNFVFCSSQQNLILDVLELPKEKINDVIKFLNDAANLFDGPIVSYTKAFNVINLLNKNFQIFESKKIVNIQKFFQMHKECSIYLILVPEE